MFKIIFVTVVAMVFSGCVGVGVNKKSMVIEKVIDNSATHSSDRNKK